MRSNRNPTTIVSSLEAHTKSEVRVQIPVEGKRMQKCVLFCMEEFDKWAVEVQHQVWVGVVVRQT